MVYDRVEGEVDPLYLHWFFDQTPLKIMPEGSAREIIDQEEEIEVRIKQTNSRWKEIIGLLLIS